MTYFVRPFTIQHSPPGAVIFAADGVHSLTSAPMRAVVTELAEKQGTVLDDLEMGAIIARNGLDQQAAVVFLMDDVGLLVPSPSVDEVRGDILVITDLPRLGDMLAECLVLPHACRVLVKDEHDRKAGSPSCVVLAMGNYCAERVHDLYAEYAAQPGIALVTSYLFRHLLIVDGPFIPSRGLPCHFCHRHHFAQGESRRWSGGDGSWISTKQHLEQKGIIVPAGVPLTAALEGMIAFSLKHEIESLFAIGNSPRLSAKHAACALVFFFHVGVAVFKYRHRGYRHALLEIGAMGQQVDLAAKELGLATRIWSGFSDFELSRALGLNPSVAPIAITQLIGVESSGTGD